VIKEFVDHQQVACFDAKLLAALNLDSIVKSQKPQNYASQKQ
jgi:hypothetical protein